MGTILAFLWLTGSDDVVLALLGGGFATAIDTKSGVLHTKDFREDVANLRQRDLLTAQSR